MYVSFSPAKIAIAQHVGSRTTRLIHESGKFSVSILSAGQLELAARAGRNADGADKFAVLDIPPFERGDAPPGVAGSLAILWARVESEQPAGDHVLFIADVFDHWVDDRQSDPLLRYRRRYAGIGPSLSDIAPEGYPT